MLVEENFGSRWNAMMLVAAVMLTLLASGSAYGDSKAKALKLYNILTGTPLVTSDPTGSGQAKLQQMTSLIDSGNLTGAAAIASGQDSFYNVTLRQFAANMSNRAET